MTTPSLRDAIAAAMHADSDHGRDGVDLLREDEPRGICNCWHKALVAEAAALKWIADNILPVAGKFRFTYPDDRPHGPRELGWVVMTGWEHESDVSIYRLSPALADALTKETNNEPT